MLRHASPTGVAARRECPCVPCLGSARGSAVVEEVHLEDEDEYDVEAEHEAEQRVGLLLGVALAVGEAVGEVRMEVGEEEDRGDDCAHARQTKPRVSMAAGRGRAAPGAKRGRAPPPYSTTSQRSRLEGRTQRMEMGTKMAIVYPYMHSTSASFLEAS